SLHLDNADISRSTVQFTVYPARSGQNSTAPDADAAPSTLLSFHSEKASWTSDGKLQVTGRLTVAHVEYVATLNANEGYSGPDFTDRVVVKVTREESFIFAIPASGRAAADVATSLTINSENFPELANAVLSTNWPAAAQEKTCEAPLTTSEDYSGTLCIGSQVITPSNTRQSVAAAEDYPGDNANAAQPGNIVTVALHLRLAQETARVSVKTGGQ
ncbi:MAG TPA: hypothetical protein VKG84_02345, partial [Candidatus Acidoferrales bacterium]|nr:hypothetical protein [Candidatus Acidoferrales bacterium]